MSHLPPLRYSILQAIGNTPVVQLRRIPPQNSADVLVKLEYFNPTSSYKDRMALAMIEEAEARGQGLGTTTTLAAARAGRELGYRIGGLVSSSEGYGVYRCLGFQECCQADIYTSPTDEMQA